MQSTSRQSHMSLLLTSSRPSLSYTRLFTVADCLNGRRSKTDFFTMHLCLCACIFVNLSVVVLRSFDHLSCVALSKFDLKVPAHTVVSPVGLLFCSTASSSALGSNNKSRLHNDVNNVTLKCKAVAVSPQVWKITQSFLSFSRAWCNLLIQLYFIDPLGKVPSGKLAFQPAHNTTELKEQKRVQRMERDKDKKNRKIRWQMIIIQ